MSDEFIFVYGTLRREIETAMSHVLARHCKFISDGYIQGRLYEVDGGYPGAIESNKPEEKIKGELYKIVARDHVLPKLDEYEACTEKYPQPHEYIRKKLPVSLVGCGTVSAWVYIFNHDISSLKVIQSGDYLTYLQGIYGEHP